MATAYRPRHMRRDNARRSFKFTPTEKQDQFLTDLFSGEYKVLGFGGAVRGGKTLAGLMAIFLLCKIFPGSRWAIVREDLPRLRLTTIPSIEKFAPRPFVGPLNHQTMTYTCENGSEIVILGEQLTKDPDLDRFKGLEVNGWLAEEANELSEKTANKMIERMGSWIIQPTTLYPEPVQPPALLICTFNPADNWVREWFYEPYTEGRLQKPYYFLQSLPTDNPYNTQDQFDAWKLMPEPDYNRFIKGDWSAIVDPYQLISYGHILAAANVEPVPGRRREGVDVASAGVTAEGDHDDTVFALIDGNIIDGSAASDLGTPWIETHNGWDEPTTAVRAKDRMDEFGILPNDYKIDSVGVGSGVYNWLRRWGKAVRAFVAGATAIPRVVPVTPRVIDPKTGYYAPKPPVVASGYQFSNIRSQAWWEFAQDVKTGKYCIRNPSKLMIRDLTAPRYRFETERKIRVDTTDEIKERIGHSPDTGTAIVMAAFEFPPQSKVVSSGTR